MGLTNNEKLKLINSIEVLKCTDSFNKKAFAFTYDNNENRKILYELGMTEEEVDFECRGCGVLDIINIGLRYAKSFSKDKGFYTDIITNYELF